MIFKLTLTTEAPSSKLLMFLHKEIGKSISDIKECCKQGKSIYECPSADTQGLVFLNGLNAEITNLGFETELFIDDVQVDAEMFANIEKRNIEIDEDNDI